MKFSRTGRGAPVRKRRAPRTPGAMEWAEDLSGQCARVTAVGSRSLLVENHTGILEFTDARVRLGTRRGTLCVIGSGLTLCDVRPDALIVRGRVQRVELPCQGGDAPDEP